MESKAKKVINLMTEQLGSAPKSLKDLPSGQQVVFAKGHAMAGMLGIVHSHNKDGSVNLLVGKSVRTNVALKDLVLNKAESGIKA